MQAHTTDNDLSAIHAGGGTMMPFHAIPSRMQELVFEARFKISSVAASSTNLYIGLGGTGAAADSGIFVDDLETFASNNFLGFARTAAMTTTLDFIYQRVGGTVAKKDDVLTIAADTYVKVGFRYHAARKQCSIWVNGAEVTASRVSSTITGAAPWPNLYMNFLAGVQYQATSAHIMYIDWWACAQML
jgi:hypothetical protein